MKAAPRARFDAVLFDCDGVLVESELITNRVLTQMLRELGWQISDAESQQLFVGRSIRDEWQVVHEHTDFMVNDEWLAEFRQRRNDALTSELTPVPGALEAVSAVHDLVDRRIACATGADRAKAQMQITMMGFDHLFEDRIFSGMDLPKTKPAPDVYIAAAAYLECDPTDAAVVEDSVAGVTAGVASGATVIGYAPPERSYVTAEGLAEAGASFIISSMRELPNVIQIARQY